MTRQQTRQEIADLFGVHPDLVAGTYRDEMLASAAAALLRLRRLEERRGWSEAHGG